MTAVLGVAILAVLFGLAGALRLKLGRRTGCHGDAGQQDGAACGACRASGEEVPGCEAAGAIAPKPRA
jgi:hypothetical protein